MTLIEQLTQKLQEVPLCISSTRRSGNGLRNADEVAAALMPVVEGAMLDKQPGENARSESRWVQAGEIFGELEKGSIHLYQLYQKYDHSPAMLAWFTTTFAPMVSETDGVLALRTKPTAPVVAGRDEQNAFETWAEEEGLNLEQHPLHYLFLDKKTYAAREGWNAAKALFLNKPHTPAHVKAINAYHATPTESTSND